MKLELIVMILFNIILLSALVTVSIVLITTKMDLADCQEAARACVEIANAD